MRFVVSWRMSVRFCAQTYASGELKTMEIADVFLKEFSKKTNESLHLHSSIS